MKRTLQKFAVIAFLGVFAAGSGTDRAQAQSHSIDCAILLCLSGGWPASVPCARARAEFIRRITPWPVEPPLQIWRCPMAASYKPESRSVPSLHDIAFEMTPTGAAASLGDHPKQARNDAVGLLVQDRADIDISGPEFDFVRSIRVWHVRSAYQRQDYEDDREYCRRSHRVELGSYGPQGEFEWRASSPYALPERYAGLEEWGEDCPWAAHRSVFVEWRDHQGNYGYEQVEY